MYLFVNCSFIFVFYCVIWMGLGGVYFCYFQFIGLGYNSMLFVVIVTILFDFIFIKGGLYSMLILKVDYFFCSLYLFSSKFCNIINYPLCYYFFFYDYFSMLFPFFGIMLSLSFNFFMLTYDFSSRFSGVTYIICTKSFQWGWKFYSMVFKSFSSIFSTFWDFNYMVNDYYMLLDEKSVSVSSDSLLGWLKESFSIKEEDMIKDIIIKMFKKVGGVLSCNEMKKLVSVGCLSLFFKGVDISDWFDVEEVDLVGWLEKQMETCISFLNKYLTDGGLTSFYLFPVVSKLSCCIYVLSEDVMHSFGMPVLGLKVDCVPGLWPGMVLEFFDGKGVVYDYFCYEYCGFNHPFMGGSFIIVSLTDYFFFSWLDLKNVTLVHSF